MMKFLFLLLSTWVYGSTSAVYAGLVDDCGAMKVGDRCKYAIMSLEPTQQFFGKKAADVKRQKLEEMSDDKRAKYLRKNPVPVVLGPDRKFHMVDHHHLAYAARMSGRENIYLKLLQDWSKIDSMDKFWEMMKAKNLVFLFDQKGKTIPISDLPTSVMRMLDNPYRSLAYFVREKECFRKSKAPFAEMLWAIFFATNMKIKEGPSGFEKAIEAGCVLAHSDKANGLPGKIGR